MSSLILVVFFAFGHKLVAVSERTSVTSLNACNCFDHSDECYYDASVADRKASINIHGVYDGGGVCINCKHHTTGINCEHCEDGYFRPQGVSRTIPEVCRKCDCQGLGMSGNCVKDESYLADGLKPGDCICKEGYDGKNCDRCAPGYKNYPRCESCYCNYAGTRNAEDCGGPCVCKANVEGSRCDRCKEGYYNLNANNPEGCSQCWCAGLTRVCKSSDWGVENIHKMKNWKVSDLEGKKIVTPLKKPDRFLIAEDDMSGTDIYYWQAPEDYLGDRLYSYGGDLRFTLGYTVLRGDTSGYFTEDADLVLQGGPKNEMIGFNWKKHSKEEEGKTTITLPLIEQEWFKLGPDKKKLGPVSRDEFAQITRKLNRLLLRAKFHTDQIEGALYRVIMEKGSNISGTYKKMKGMEDCECPPGYTGPSCLKCAAGYRWIDGRCQNCVDGCTDVLVDDIAAMTILIRDANISDIANLPYTRLQYLIKRYNELVIDADMYRSTVGSGYHMLNNITFNFYLETLADILHLKVMDIEPQAPIVLRNAVRVADQAEELLDLISDLFNELMRLIDNIKRYGIDSIGPAGYAYIERLLQEAERILDELKRRDFKPKVEEAERELRKARNLLARIRSLITSPGHSQEAFDRLNRLSHILSEIITLVQENVQRPVQHTLRIVGEGRRQHQVLLAMVENSTTLAELANVSLVEARRLIDEARTEVIEAAVKFGLLPTIKQDLDNLTQAVEKRRSILARLNPEYAEKYVAQCQRHVQDLIRRLDHLKGLFFPTKEFSSYYLRAAQAYQKIVDALAAAEEAAKRAFAAAERAYKEAYPGTDDSLTKQALKAKQRSYQLLEEAKTLRDVKLPELERFLIEKKILLDNIGDDLSNGERNLELINRALDSLPKGLNRALKEAYISLRNILESLGDVHQHIDAIEYRITTELLPKLDRLKAVSTSGIENLTKIIEKARTDIKHASKIAFNAEEISERVNRRQSQLELDLKELKDKILLARQKAAGIRVSLAADDNGVCVRSFRPEIEPSSTNNIVLTYGTKDEAKDAMLFFISSATNDDFMAIEMIDRKIRFLWNAGGGTQVLEHSLIIETNDQQLSKDTQWYKIEVIRIANVAILNVQRTPDAHKEDVNAVTGSSPPGFSRMDFDANSHLYVGGLPYDFKPPRELRSRTFSGCLYEVILGGKRVNLWNFKTNNGCKGCKQGAAEKKDPTVFQFTGEGSYAILPQIRRYDKRKYLVGLQFKTFDEDALLFVSPAPSSGDCISVILKEGRVLYQFSLGSTVRLQLITKQKYNNGQWVRIAAERDKLEGVLSVEDELLQTEVQAGGLTTLDLSESKLYFGGVPPNFTTSVWPTITFKPFLGCMKDIQIDTTPLDLVNTDAYGVDHGCRDKAAKVVTFRGIGFLELNGKALREEADFSFTFKTLQNNALLLLSTYQSQTKGRQKDSHYYSVAVVGGLLEARFNGGAGETTLISEIRVNDGSFHTVTVSKRHRRISITLDDRDVGASRLARATKNIEAPEDGGLFLGGISSQMTLRGMADTKVPLKGVIRDFVFNGKQLNLNEPVQFHGVGIGHEKDDFADVNEIDDDSNDSKA